MSAIADRLQAAAGFLNPKVPDIADLLMVGVIAGSTAVSFVNGSFIFADRVLTASILGFAMSYLITSRSLRSRKELGVERLFISLCALVSAVSLFEIVWRLWGFDTWNLVPRQLVTLTFASPFPLSWFLLMVGLVFAGAPYMGLNKWFFLTLGLAIGTFWIWKDAGFPQFPHPEWWPSKHPSIPLLPIEYSHPTTEAARAYVASWGALLNSLTKVFWCALPGTLFLTRENLGGPLSGRLWPPGPAMKRLLLPWKDWRAASPRSANAVGGPTPAAAPVAHATLAKAGDDGASGAPTLQEPRNFCERVRVFVRTRLADLADVSMLGVLVAVVAVAAANHTFVLTGRVLATSIAAYALCYLIASRSLRRCEGVGWERIFIAACAMVSGIWLFEVVYHFGWLASWEQLSRSFTDFNIRPPALPEPFPLMWSFIMVSVVFVGARHMRVNKWFYLVLAVSAATFVLWLAVGYPSFRDPWRFPQHTDVIKLIPAEFNYPRTPAAPGWGVIAFWGAVFTGVTKFLICMLPATLFVHNLRRGEAGAYRPPDDILARAWKVGLRRLGFLRGGGEREESAAAPGAQENARGEPDL